jgi:hypothetical protein
MRRERLYRYAYRNADTGCGAGCSPVMIVSKCACTCSMVKPAWYDAGWGADTSSEAISIVWSSFETVGELACRPASIHLAWRPCQPTARVASSCFCFVKRPSHNVLELTVMAEEVHGG